MKMKSPASWSTCCASPSPILVPHAPFENVQHHLEADVDVRAGDAARWDDGDVHRQLGRADVLPRHPELVADAVPVAADAATADPHQAVVSFDLRCVLAHASYLARKGRPLFLEKWDCRLLCAASCTSTWTPSTRRSSSATSRRCAASRSRSAATRQARRRRGGELRGARVRRALGDPDGARGPALPAADHRAAGLPAVPRRVAGGVRHLPLGDAAGRAAVARRGVSRRDRERVGRGARQGGRAAAEGRDHARRPDSPRRQASRRTSSWRRSPRPGRSRTASR